EVQKEPLLALDGGCDGLKFYKIILKNYNDYLVQNGKVFLEIGYNQKEMLFNLLDLTKQNINPKCIKDLSGNDRLIIF
ncbi:MAG: peptide chain release factor N(5)-glutamine methyltransferase, partial [Clostridia bacterium]|nr:peptide chain release factor N(5)-glutamine methyltransferase [Clostridia bacterium]